MAVTAESLTELIDEAQNALDAVQDEINTIAARQRELIEQRAVLEAERNAFIASLERRFPGTPSPVPNATVRIGSITASIIPVDGWPLFSRSEAVERVVKELTEEKGFATPAEIERVLASKGRSDDRTAIGASLAHLNRQNKIHSLTRAQWIYGAEG